MVIQTFEFQNTRIESVLSNEITIKDELNAYNLTDYTIQKIKEKITDLLVEFKFLKDLYLSICRRKRENEKFPVQPITVDANTKVNEGLKNPIKLNLGNLIESEMFYQDMRTLERLYLSCEMKLTKRLFFLHKKFGISQQQVYKLAQLLFKNQIQFCPLPNPTEYLIFFMEKRQFIINSHNYMDYLRMVDFFILKRQGQMDLYNFVFDMVNRWICGMSQHLKQKRLTLLQEAQDELSQLFILEQEEDPFFLKIHQIVIQNNLNLLTEQSLILYSEMENFNHPCCLSFVYHSTILDSNKLLINRRSDNLIIMQYPQQLKNLEPLVKEAASALLNNDGGFIFVGFQKHNQFYLPSCPIKFTHTLLDDLKKEISTWFNPCPGFLKNFGLDTAYKNIKFEFIPIFKKRKFNIMQKEVYDCAQEGQFICRFTVFPDNVSKLLVHPISDKFYDLNPEEETYHRIKDSQESRDLIYKKLKQRTLSHGIFVCLNTKPDIKKIPQKIIPRKNNPKLINHIHNCTIPQNGAFPNDPKDTQVNTSGMDDRSNRLKTKFLKEGLNLSTKKMSTAMNEDQTTEFKHINLIVLENKKTKDECEKFLSQKKVQFKIEKLQTNLKKLSKTTYIIQHHKKYEQMNTYLMDFKKQINSNKKIILISAQKSAYIEMILKAEELEKVGQMLKNEFPEVVKNEEILYVEEKDKERKSYLKGNTKITGIYLYFILSELDVKSDVKVKMKNVPLNLVNYMVPLNKAIDDKLNNAIKEKKQNELQKQKQQNNQNNKYNSYNNNYSNKKYPNNYSTDYANNYSNYANYNSNNGNPYTSQFLTFENSYVNNMDQNWDFTQQSDPQQTYSQQNYTENIFNKEYFALIYQNLLNIYKQNYDQVTAANWILANFKQYVLTNFGETALNKLEKLIQDTKNEYFYAFSGYSQ